MTTRANTIALWLAVLSVAALWPGALDRWVLPKILLLGVAALVSLLAVPRGRLPRWALILIGAGTLVLVIAALFGESPLAALLGIWPRFEGLVTGGGYLIALWLGARLRATAREFVPPVATLGLLVGAVSIAETLGARPFPSDLARPGSLLGNATDQGAVGAVVVLLLILPLWRARGVFRWFVAAGVLAGLVTVIAAGSRAALLALLLGIAAIVVVEGRRNRRALVAGAGLFAATFAAALLAPSIGPRLLGSSGFSASTIADRWLIWSESLELVARHPFAGVGPSGFVDAIVGVHNVRWFSSIGQTTVLDSPHNAALQLLVVGGPLLLAIGVAFLVGAVRTVVRQRGDFSQAVAVAAFAVVLLTHVTSPSTVLLAMLLVGGLISSPASAPRKQARLAAAAVISAWVALVSVTLAGEVALGGGDFATAAALRPWDTRTPLISAEALTARVDGGDAGAATSALEWSQRALEAAPTSTPAAKALITSALAVGDLDTARATAEKFAELRPKEPWIASRLGAIRLLDGDDVAAEKLLLRATELDPTFADPWLTLAYLYEQRGDTARAAAASARAAEL